MARPTRAAGEKSTREQILDVALELFVQEGFENTSLRQIAERMNFSKAALYYHFASKDDILLALHLRLHDLGTDSLSKVDLDGMSPDGWIPLLDGFIDQLLANRALVLLHMRNRAALEKIAHSHGEANGDIEERIRRLLTDPRVPAAPRLRLAFSFGAVAIGLVMSGTVFEDISPEEMASELRGAIRDLLSPAVTKAPAAEANGASRASGAG